jgi:ABC-type transporter Mla subunit MlaD
MNKDRNALKAGTFIIVSAILIAAIIVGIQDFGRFAQKSTQRSARFKLTDDIGGLRVGDEVRLGGYKVGSIKSIEAVGLDGPPQDAGLVVTFTMPQKYVLRDGAVVAVQTSLTGSAVLNIANLGAGTEVASGVAVAGQPDPKSVLFTGLGDFTPRLNTIMQHVQTQTLPKFEETITTATQTLAEAKSKIDPAYEKYAKIADNVGEAMVEARGLVADSRPDVRDTLANVKSATGTVKEKIPETMEKVNSVLTKVETSVEKLQTSLDDVKVALANTKELSASAKAIVVGNRSKLDAVFASVKATGDNLKAASSEIRRSPWRLLYKPGKGEMANLNLYDAARQFAEGANDMNDAATALRDALATKDVDEQQLQGLVDRLDKSFTSFRKVETTLWNKVKE